MLFVIWSLVITVGVALYLRRAYSRFSKYGVNHLPVLPLMGNSAKNIFRINHVAYETDKLYKTFPNDKFMGKYDFLDPVVMVRDLDLIKKIAVKDFEHFLDHRSFVDDKIDTVFGRNLFSLKGEEWKEMRSTLSPAFTSSKIRLMVPFMVEIADQTVKKINSLLQKQAGVDYIDIDAKEITTRYANDVIASCAFGFKVDSHFDQNNQFYLKGKEATTFNFIQTLKAFSFISFPKLISKLNLKFFSEEVTNFYRQLVLGTIKDREDHNIVRPDMIHLLMEAKKGRLTHEDKVDADAGFATVEESSVGKKNIQRVWTDDDLVGQAVIFLIAGFETVSSVMTFLMHELAINPEVQQKLYQEILDNEAKNSGKFDYNSIQQMAYLDMVISETLRLWPPVPFLDRHCTKDYNLGKPNEKSSKDYIIRKGEHLGILTWGLHHDPQYFPEPNKFVPERFSDENKHTIHPFTYMPFGLGPRNCIGSRFALCEIKVMAYQVLRSIEISPAAKTQIPAKLCPSSFNIRIKGGNWVRLRARK